MQSEWETFFFVEIVFNFISPVIVLSFLHSERVEMKEEIIVQTSEHEEVFQKYWQFFFN